MLLRASDAHNGLDQESVERLSDLGLQARLLVKRDLDVGQQQELGTRLEIAFEEQPVVSQERLAQVVLSLGRITGSQLVTEGRDLAGVKRNVAQASREEAGKLASDLLEDILVASAYGVARAIDRRPRPPGLSH